MTKRTIRIGTRGSDLALYQARLVAQKLQNAHADIKTELVIIKTSGDWTPKDGETPLPENVGGKALFAKEIEEALLEGSIDIAVHSMKDMDSNLPEGLVIDHMLPREDAHDAILFNNRSLRDTPISNLPAGFTFGTTSPRRAAFLKKLNPNLKIVALRGNVPTRIEKLRSGQVVGATLLAVAGLNRLGLQEHIDQIVDINTFIPAAGQGAIGIEHLESKSEIADLLSPISCHKTTTCVKLERALLRGMNGNCKTAVGIHASYIDHESINIDAAHLSSDGKKLGEINEVLNVADFNTAKIRTYELGQTLRH